MGPALPKVIILGGTGVFGFGLAQRLVRSGELHLVLAGRDGRKAQQHAEALAVSMRCGRVTGVSVSLGPPLREALAELNPDIVVHAAGPFQGQGYEVAEAALSAGAHYIDLADGREFVLGFPQHLDEVARSRGRIALTGMSSVPALSSAAVRALRWGFERLTSIDFGISPGNRAPRGDAVVRAILSYCGEPIAGWSGGREKERYGWQGLRRETIGGLGGRWFCDCDVPDIALFARAYPEVSDIRFGAGLELDVLHLGLWALSSLRRRGLMPPLERFAGPMRSMAELLMRFGSDRGGMFVHVRGQAKDGTPRNRRWELVAGEGDGPYVPTLPAAIMVRKILAGDAGEPGARTGFEAITLDEFVREASDLRIETKIFDGG